jgi:multidrug efflux pump subunit AcrA (membrane-fusion protein)
MKRKSKGRKLLISAICLVLVAAIGAGVWFVTANPGGDPVPVFPFLHVGMTEYWGDSQECYGSVQTDGVQTVYLSGTQTVTEILVEQGQEVKKGDVLMTFDTTLSDLALERKRLDVEQLKLQLEDAKKRLREINAMKPMVIPQPSQDPEEEVNLGEKLTDSYKLSHNTDYDGSIAERALICWLHSGTALTDSILNELTLQAMDFQAINAEKEAEEIPPEEETVPGTEPAEPTEATEAPTDPTDPVEDPTEPDETEPSEPEENIKCFYVVFKVTEDNYALAYKTTWQGIYVIRDMQTGVYSFKFFDAGLVQDHMLAPDEETEEEPEIDFGSGFTAAQIAEMRSQQEKVIKDLEFNIKMAEADYKIAQTEVSDGNVYATIDGVVVSLLTEDEATMMMQPIIKVSAGGGFYVEGTVGELDRDTLVIGQEVTVNDWSTGMTYIGRIESLGDYPSTENGWNGMGNPSSSYYPFRVFVEESADLQSGSYVSIVFSAGSSVQGVYLENPFLRTENGRSYVYVAGEDGRLEKRFVTTGKSLWGNYTQILEGLGEEDLLAFPYGKNVKPGAETVESDISVLYE